MKNFWNSLIAGAIAAFVVLGVGDSSHTSRAVAMATFFLLVAIIAWGNEIIDKIDRAVKELKEVPRKETPASFEG